MTILNPRDLLDLRWSSNHGEVIRSFPLLDLDVRSSPMVIYNPGSRWVESRQRVVLP